MYFSFKELTLLSLYNILTYIAEFHLKIIALFNHKIKLGVNGRMKTLSILESHITKNDKTIWLHCASLGEYEQGLPVFEELKSVYPKHKLVLSFFSPSGFEVKKNNSIADVVIYLPLDTKSNANLFLDAVHPELVIFVKYEIWPNYLNALKSRNIRSILISALFRKDQSFFKPLGKWMLKSFEAFDHIFVQNHDSKLLLTTHGINNVTVSGDTRFDRVSNQLKIDNKLAFVEEFKQDKLCIVAGSTWPEDEKLLIEFINDNKNSHTKFIIAPHNIKPHIIASLQNNLKKKTVLYSEKENIDLSNFSVLIIDTIGLLSKIYSYADIAYVGGAVGNTGLHNTLEPAIFGVPIIIGVNHGRFPEAIDMINEGGMFAIENQKQLHNVLNEFIENDEKRVAHGKINQDYIKKNQGAVIQITNFIRK